MNDIFATKRRSTSKSIDIPFGQYRILETVKMTGIRLMVLII